MGKKFLSTPVFTLFHTVGRGVSEDDFSKGIPSPSSTSLLAIGKIL